MKASAVKERPGARLLTRCRALAETPIARKISKPALYFAAPLLLSAASLGGSPLPLAACFVLTAGLWVNGAAAALGAAVGYVLLWGWAQALEPLALTVLFYAALVIFRKTPISPSVLAAALTGTVGAVFLLDTGFSLLYLTRYLAGVGLAYAAPPLYRRATEKGQTAARQALGVLGLLCLAGFLPPVGLALACAAALGCTVCSQRVLPALLCGLAVDVGAGLGGQMTGALALGWLCCSGLQTKDRVHRGIVCFCVCELWQLFFGSFSLPIALGSALGAAGGTLLGTVGRPLLPGLQIGESSLHPARTEDEPAQLKKVARVMAGMYETLAAEPGSVTTSELAEVYDFAADQVCKCCVSRELCWEQAAEDTYRDLCAAGKGILRRGAALREDLPDRFQNRCRHVEGFLTAVNQELDAGLTRRRQEHRLREGRDIAACQYLFVSNLLNRLATTSAAPAPEQRFSPELAVGSASRAGSPVSGDRGATCKDRRGNFYVLLCDGMGSGGSARQESDRAARLLTGLLEAGVAPDTAMEQLNSFFVLRSTTVFATMDLLQVSLDTAEGVLYKWGAAPSYLFDGAEVKKIGTASPPPGCGVGAVHSARQYPLSLKEGETLVMVSDGAFGEETEKRITDAAGGTVRDLASCLITLGEQENDDDRTAVVLRLSPLGSE